MSKFKPGDKVRMKQSGKYYEHYFYGEVTIIGNDGRAKVLFNDEIDYTYYDDEVLELVKDTEDEQ